MRSSPKRRLDAAEPLRLDELAGDFLVTQGYVDLFSIDRASKDGESATGTGPRRHVARIGAGGALARMAAASDLALIAVGGLDTAIERLADDLVAGSSNPAGATLLDGWVTHLAEAVFGPIPAWSDLPATPDTTLDLPAGGRLTGGPGVVWVVAADGGVRLDQGSGSGSGTPIAIPLAGALSVSADDPTPVRVMRTKTAAAEGLVEGGLAMFQAAVLTALSDDRRKATSEASQRLTARDGVNRQRMAAALGGLAGVVAREPASSPPAGGAPPLVAAFARICESLDVPFRVDSQRSPDTSVETLARNAGLGCRRILLRGRWWIDAQGPLIGILTATEQPVVLLAGRDRRYRLVDPVGGTAKPVDAALADTLDVGAMLLYTPLPAETRGLWQLVRFGARGNFHDVTTVVAVSLAATVLAALVPVATGILFDTAVPNADVAQIGAVVGGLLAAAIGAAAFDLTRAVALLRVEARIEGVLQPALMLRLLTLPVNFFREYTSGDLYDRVLALPQIRRLLAGTTIVSVLGLLFSLSSIVVILFYSGVLALVAIGLVAVAAAFTAIFSLFQLRPQRLVTDLGGRENAFVVQLFQGVAKIRTTASEPRLFAVWAQLFARKKLLTRRSQSWANARGVFFGIYPTLAELILFLTVANLAGLDHGGLDQAALGGATPKPPGAALGLGSFLAVNAAFGQLLAAITAVASVLTGLLNTVPLFERLSPILKAAPETHRDGLDPGPLNGPIDISRLTFRYGPDDPLVLDDISLKIKPGQFLAVVGASGSGKSTLLRILLGFDAPTSGDIFYQGHPVGTLDPTALRRRIGVVLQNGRITTGTIFENITAGMPYTQDAAWEAARLAGLAEEIEAMPMGLHTLLMEGAVSLSGGQMQRVMIARALIGKPELLIFDEATSALDNRSQAVVTQSLDRLGVTRIVVAHRLSTIVNADHIVVLDRGRVIEQGTFADLMAHDRAFRRLARRQML